MRGKIKQAGSSFKSKKGETMDCYNCGKRGRTIGLATINDKGKYGAIFDGMEVEVVACNKCAKTKGKIDAENYNDEDVGYFRMALRMVG